MIDYTQIAIAPEALVCLAFLIFGIGCYVVGRAGL
jgi:hypothetical protein